MAGKLIRERILKEGLRVVTQHGFIGASVRDIVFAAEVPIGSFTNHFASKEAFVLELLERYVEHSYLLLNATLGDAKMSPGGALVAYVRECEKQLEHDGVKYGCLAAKLSVDVNHSEGLRLALLHHFNYLEIAVRSCLERAIMLGELPPATDVVSLAGGYLGGLLGAVMMSRLQNDTHPLACFEQRVKSFFPNLF